MANSRCFPIPTATKANSGSRCRGTKTRRRRESRQHLPAPRCLDGGDIDLLHRHHRRERTLSLIAAGGERVGERARRELTRQALAVLALPAGAFGAAIADDRVPVAVGFFLCVGGNLKRERLVGLECRTAVEA